MQDLNTHAAGDFNKQVVIFGHRLIQKGKCLPCTYVNFTNMDFVNLVIAVGIPIITPFVKMPVVNLFNAPTDI